MVRRVVGRGTRVVRGVVGRGARVVVVGGQHTDVERGTVRESYVRRQPQRMRLLIVRAYNLTFL